MKKALITCLILILSISVVQAEEEGWFFFGAGLGLYRLDGGAKDAEPINTFLRGGISLNRYLDVGIEFSSTQSEDEIDGFDFEIDTTFVYLKLNYVLNDDTKVYVLGGATEVELTTTFPQPILGRSKARNDDTGIGYGVGIEFRQDSNGAVIFEYINYFDDEFDDSDIDFFVDSYNLGLLWYF